MESEKGKLRDTTLSQENEMSRKTKIIVERSFGSGNLLELYSDYVAGKVQKQMKNHRKTEEYSQ